MSEPVPEAREVRTETKPSGGAAENLFGRLAVQFGLVTMDQLSQAAQLQARTGTSKKLGDLFVEQGWMSKEEVAALLETQRARREAEERAREAETETDPRGSVDRRSRSASRRTSAPVGVPTATTAPRLRLQDFVAVAVERDASDLHLHAGALPKIRLHGDLVSLGQRPLLAQHTQRMVEELLEPAQLEQLHEKGQVDLGVNLDPRVGELASGPIDGAASAGPRLRFNVYRQRQGFDLVARVIPAEPPTLSSLGLPIELARLANYPRGLVLITGPVGSGKSSTLAALLDLINEERSEHIITAEDPIEFVHRSKRCVVNQREVGAHSSSCARILRAALREDPDIIALGELRDNESFELALSAAETGHLVLGTLHTGRAVGTMHRIIGSFPPGRQDQVRTQLSETLRAVVSQRLARRADGSGRVALLETMVVNRAVAHLIRDNKLHQIYSQMQTGQEDGMCLLENYAGQMLAQGLIDEAEALRFGYRVEDVA